MGKKKGATKKGVPKTEPEVVQEEQTEEPTEQEIIVKMESMMDDSHERQLDEVTASIRQGQEEDARERASALEEGEEESEEPAPEPEAEADSTEDTEDTEKPDEGVAEATEDEEHEVKIEGKTQRKKTSDIRKELAEYQKHGAADKRLEEATRLLKEAQELTAKANKTLPKERSDDELNKIRKAYINALQYGTGSDEDIAAMRAYEEAFGRGGAQPTVNQDEIVQTVRQATRQTIDVVERERRFYEDNKDVMEDPFWRGMVERQTEMIFSSDRSKDPFEIATEVVQAIREKTGNPKQEEPRDELRVKRERKMETQSIPQASGRVPAPPTPEEQRPKTMAEQIAEINREREGISLKKALQGKY